MIKFSEFLKLSKQIAASLLKDEKVKALESTNLFSSKDKEDILNRLTDKSKIESRLQLKSKIDRKEDWKTLKAKLNVPNKTYYWQYAAAASIVLILGVTFIFDTIDTKITTTEIVNTPIEIGTDKAVLTLSDGSTVLLDSTNVFHKQGINGNGKEIVYDVVENNNETLKYNFLTIPRGGQFKIKLSDDTEVWLNSDSQLKYPVNFIKGQPREVELVYGEAYLEVSKSTEHQGDAFVLKTNQQDITVLGTIFNVKAYDDENDVVTTLAEGSIAVSNTINKRILRAGQQSKLTKGKDSLEIYTVEVDEFISWHKGKFSFTNKSLVDIMKVLSRWYDVDIVIVNKELENIGFTGVINKKQPIENILGIIQNTINMNYTIEHKHIRIQ